MLLKKITIVLLLKGRFNFTVRWLLHANEIQLPFDIIIADGEINSPVANFFLKNKIFRNLNIEYYSYSDNTYLDFYKKIFDVLTKVRTPYVMIVDNDDFLVPSGIEETIKFLEKNSDYVCAGGSIAHFEIEGVLNSNVLGKLKNLWYQQRKAYQNYDLSSDSASDRVLSVYEDLLTVWYNTYRIEPLRILTKEMSDFNFERLETAEIFHKLRTVTMGKIKSDKSYISYLRQMGTSTNIAENEDVIGDLISSKFINENQLIRKNIISLVSEIDNLTDLSFELSLNKLATDKLTLKLKKYFSLTSKLKYYAPKYIWNRLSNTLSMVGSMKNSGAGGRPITKRTLFKLLGCNTVSQELLSKQILEINAFNESISSDRLNKLIAELSLYTPPK